MVVKTILGFIQEANIPDCNNKKFNCAKYTPFVLNGSIFTCTQTELYLHSCTTKSVVNFPSRCLTVPLKMIHLHVYLQYHRFPLGGVGLLKPQNNPWIAPPQGNERQVVCKAEVLANTLGLIRLENCCVLLHNKL